MTPIAIATLVTSFFAVVSVLINVKDQHGTTSTQRGIFFGGLFGLVWSMAFLLGA